MPIVHHVICDVILDSLEKQWSVADQDVFIAGVILNPLHKAMPFVKSPQFTAAGIISLINHLWTCFYNEPIPHEFFRELRDYFEEKGQYEFFKAWIPGLRGMAVGQVSKMKPCCSLNCLT